MVGLGCALVVSSLGSSAHATGFELGGRLGYGIPLGKADGDSDLSDGISGMVPLQLDLGYRATPALSVGGYLMYGFGFAGNTISDRCDVANATPGVSASCGAHDLRLGLQAQYHFIPKRKLDPWVGLGLGYEWLTLTVDASAAGQHADVSSTGKGFEFINLQGGLDFNLSPGFGLGPFLSFSVGQYSSTSSSCSGDCTGVTETSGDVADKAIHQWLLLGVRGTFVFGDQEPIED